MQKLKAVVAVQYQCLTNAYHLAYKLVHIIHAEYWYINLTVVMKAEKIYDMEKVEQSWN